MDRLSALDAEFLHLDDDIGRMHIAGVCVFADPPLPLADIRRLVGSQLDSMPRYRQRVRTVPLDLGRPVWVDDVHFRLSSHFRRVALPSPGGERELDDFVGQLMSQPLDRSRPLWEVCMVEGISGGRWALVFKLHHCMVDGIAGVELLTTLLSIEPDAVVDDDAQSWRPRTEPSGVRLLIGAVARRTNAGSAAAHVVASMSHPLGAVRQMVNTTRGTVALLGRIRLSPPDSIEGTISAHRVWASSSASLEDVRTIRGAFGGTVNDVVLAAVSAGYRELLTARGDDPDRTVVRSLVPVSVRRPDSQRQVDNEVSMLLVDLPVHIADPRQRLRLVRRQMNELKSSHMANAGEAMTRLGQLAPPALVAGLTHWAVQAEHRMPQRVVNTVTTNVPGPQLALYCLGSELLEYRPYVPISHGLRVGTAILSYNGRLFFGVTGDESVPEVDIVARGTAAAIDELRAMACGEQAG